MIRTLLEMCLQTKYEINILSCLKNKVRNEILKKRVF